MDVLVVLGSSSDLNIAKECTKVLDEFNVSYKLLIASAHRTPAFLEQNLEEAKKNNVKVIIAMAGMAAHLPGVIASKTIIPVIGVPIASKNLGGIDAMFSILQMPSGYPVATVSIDGAKNSALLSLSILAINNNILKEDLNNYRNKMTDAVIESNKNI